MRTFTHKLFLQTLEHRDTPSNFTPDNPPFDTATIAYTDANTRVWVAGEGGGPRVTVERGGEVVANFFAFEPSFRGGCFATFADDQLYVGPGPGGGLVEARYDLDQPVLHGVPVEVSREFKGQSDLRHGWQPVAPPHPRDVGLIPVTNDERFPVRQDQLDAVKHQLTFIPRPVQRMLMDAGARVVAHAGNVTDLFGGNPDAATGIGGDGERTLRTVFSFHVAGTAYINPGVGGAVHELGHAAWYLLLTDAQRATYSASWETWPPRAEYERLNVTEAFAEDFRRWCYFGEDDRGMFAALGW